MLQVLKGSAGANKTYWVSRPAAKVQTVCMFARKHHSVNGGSSV